MDPESRELNTDQVTEMKVRMEMGGNQSKNYTDGQDDGRN